MKRRKQKMPTGLLYSGREMPNGDWVVYLTPGRSRYWDRVATRTMKAMRFAPTRFPRRVRRWNRIDEITGNEYSPMWLPAAAIG